MVIIQKQISLLQKNLKIIAMGPFFFSPSELAILMTAMTWINIEQWFPLLERVYPNNTFYVLYAIIENNEDKSD